MAKTKAFGAIIKATRRIDVIEAKIQYWRDQYKLAEQEFKSMAFWCIHNKENHCHHSQLSSKLPCMGAICPIPTEHME